MTKLTRQANSRLSQRKRGTSPLQFSWQKLFANTSAVNIALLSLCLSLGMAYLGVVNSAASDTFAVSELQDRVAEAKSEAQDLELALTEAQSLQHVKSMSEGYALVAGGEVQYADASTAVALSE